MKKIIEQIKFLGFRDWLKYFSPKPLSYIGDLLNFISPPHRDGLLDKIRYKINPRQKWIKKHIEYNCWCDKVELIPKFLFGCVVHFVEEEKCFDTVDWKASSKDHTEFENELCECYEYIKVKRPSLEKQMDYAYDNLPEAQTYHERYADVIRIEKEIDDADKKYMAWIVENKDFMWT